jgi:hypothetical protein
MSADGRCIFGVPRNQQGVFVKKLAFLSLLAAASLNFAAPAAATDFSYTGTLSGPSDVQLFNFVVGSQSTVTLRTYSYAGGTMADGTVISNGGFDPILALFDSSGQLIMQNDDGAGSVPADPNTGNHWDTYLQQILQPGTYTVSVMAFSNFANGPNLSDGFENDGSFNGRNSNWAFDILGVSEATQVGAVPEPSTWAMMLIGFGAIGFAVRRQKKAALATA